jgi:hypothetical protein
VNQHYSVSLEIANQRQIDLYEAALAARRRRTSPRRRRFHLPWLGGLPGGRPVPA